MTNKFTCDGGYKKPAIFILSYFLLLGLGVASVNATISGDAPAGLPLNQLVANALTADLGAVKSQALAAGAGAVALAQTAVAPQPAVITALVNAGAASPPFGFVAKTVPPGLPWGPSGNGVIRGDRNGKGESHESGDRDDRRGNGDGHDSHGKGHRGHRGGGGGTASPCR